MTRKDLQERYNIIGHNKDVSLYRKRGEYTYGIGYCGNISLKNGKAIFNGAQYTQIESLDEALRKWEKSLPYPVDTYNPLMRESARIEQRVTWYLTEKMGFKHPRENWKDEYIKNIGPNCRLKFALERSRDDFDDIKIQIVSEYGGAFFRYEFDNAESGIAAISTIIKESVLQMAADMVDCLSVCPDVEVPNIESYVKTNENIFGFKEVSFKDMMISLLEKELEKLKNEKQPETND